MIAPASKPPASPPKAGSIHSLLSVLRAISPGAAAVARLTGEWHDGQWVSVAINCTWQLRQRIVIGSRTDGQISLVHAPAACGASGGRFRPRYNGSAARAGDLPHEPRRHSVFAAFAGPRRPR